MASPDAELQRALGDLPFRVRRQLVEAIREQADGLAEAIKAEAPVKTGALRDSVQVRRGRKTLELVVTAGGEATTKPVKTSTYGEGGAYDYDYALALEYGTVAKGPQPFFYPVVREREADIRAAIEAAVADAMEST